MIAIADRNKYYYYCIYAIIVSLGSYNGIVNTHVLDEVRRKMGINGDIYEQKMCSKSQQEWRVKNG